MTLRATLAKYLTTLLAESSNGHHPTPSPESIPPITTPSTRDDTTALVTTILESVAQMQERSQREMRALVIEILQGREMSPDQREALTQPLRDSFDPPDYDSPDTTDLPSGIQAIFEREQNEADELRQLRTEQEVLAQQRAEMRTQLEGLAEDNSPHDSGPSFLTD